MDFVPLRVGILISYTLVNCLLGSVHPIRAIDIITLLLRSSSVARSDEPGPALLSSARVVQPQSERRVT